MATIRLRKTARGERRYYVEVRLRGHPPVRNTLSTRAAATRWARGVEAEVRAGRMLPRMEAAKHTLRDAVGRYIREHIGQLSSAPSIRDRKAQLKWWVGELGAYTLDRLTPAVISTAWGKLTCSGPTRNRYLSALSAVLRLAAVEWQWIEANPASRIRRRQEGRGRVRFLSDDERSRLLDACRESKEPRLYPLVLAALTTGARQGELLGLRWRDVDTSSDPPRAVLHRTKNRDRRTLSFPGQAATVLRDLPRFREYLFDTKRGPYFPRKAWLDALTAAQIEDFRFHDLRHSAASYLAMSGATLAEIASFLGHRTLEMVRRYAHLTEQHQEEVARRMADRFLR